MMGNNLYCVFVCLLTRSSCQFSVSVPPFDYLGWAYSEGGCVWSGSIQGKSSYTFSPTPATIAREKDSVKAVVAAYCVVLKERGRPRLTLITLKLPLWGLSLCG